MTKTMRRRRKRRNVKPIELSRCSRRSELNRKNDIPTCCFLPLDGVWIRGCCLWAALLSFDEELLGGPRWRRVVIPYQFLEIVSPFTAKLMRNSFANICTPCRFCTADALQRSCFKYRNYILLRRAK